MRDPNYPTPTGLALFSNGFWIHISGQCDDGVPPNCVTMASFQIFMMFEKYLILGVSWFTEKKGGSRQRKVVHGWYTGGTRPPGFMIDHRPIYTVSSVFSPNVFHGAIFASTTLKRLLSPYYSDSNLSLSIWSHKFIKFTYHICLLDQHPLCGLGQLQSKNYKLARLQINF